MSTATATTLATATTATTERADVFAELWRRNFGPATITDGERPAYPAPAPVAEPPRDVIAADVIAINAADDGERLILRAADGREFHFFRDGLFRWATRTAETILVETGIRPGPQARRLWIRNIASGTWWTDSAVCHYVT